MGNQERDDNKKKMAETGQHPEENGYRFMDQTIKKPPVSRKVRVFQVLGILAAGVAIGVIASLVFSLTQPVFVKGRAEVSSAAESTYGEMQEENKEPESAAVSAQPAEPEKQEKAEIPEGDSGTEIQEEKVSAEEKAAAEEKTPAEEGSQTAEPETLQQQEEQPPEKQENTETPAEDPEAETESEREHPGITLLEYRDLYRDMMAVAEEPEHALVQVIGITSEMDYFNQNYENQRRLSGLVAAMTKSDLYILTEYRVVDQVERIQVVFYDGSMTDATFQKADANTGLAVLKVPLDSIGDTTKEEIIAAPFGNSNLVKRGEPVLALGSPLGVADSIAYGIVTSTSSKVSVVDTEYALLTTDIDGTAEGSGVLISLDGKIIGIITHHFGSSTGSITGLAISQISGLIEDLSNNEPQNYAGIRGQDVTQDIADRTGIPRGLLVTEAEEDSPAMLAGLKEYDVIVRVDGRPVENIRQYQRILSSLTPGDSVVFNAMRRGTEGYAEMSFEVTIDSR